MRKPPDFYTGSPIDSSDLRYRDGFLDELWETLKTKHVILTAPRRTGKTSAMDHLRELPKNGYAAIYENVQDLSHPAEFFTALLSRFYDEHPNLFRDTFGKGWDLTKSAMAKIKEIGFSEFKIALRESDPDWQKNWRQHGTKFLEQIRSHGNPILLIVDELPDMLLNMKREHPELVREFLAWFRTQRQTPKPKQDPVRWLIGGSVNLSSTLDAMGMVDLINDFEDVTLPILTEDQVRDFVSTMLSEREVEFDPAILDLFVALLGRPIPLFMQMVTLDLYRLWKKEQRPLIPTDITQAFANLVVSNAARDKLQHYYSRIGRYYDSPKDTAAHFLLSQLSLSESGIGRQQLLQDFERHLGEMQLALLPHERKQQFNQLLRDLENDFYITETDTDRYDFSSGLLKSWWKKYYA